MTTDSAGRQNREHEIVDELKNSVDLKIFIQSLLRA